MSINKPSQNLVVLEFFVKPILAVSRQLRLGLTEHSRTTGSGPV